MKGTIRATTFAVLTYASLGAAQTVPSARGAPEASTTGPSEPPPAPLASSQAPPPARGPAAQFARGLDAFAAGAYATAAEAFRLAYEGSGRVEVLFNLGRALEETGELRAALDAFRRFDREMPATFSREEVLDRIAALERRIAPPVVVRPAPISRPVARTRTVSQGPPTGAIALLIGGGVALGGALALGLAERAALDGCRVDGDVARCPNRAAFDRARDAPGLAIATNVTLGIGLAALAAGASWWLLTPSRRTVSVSVGPGAVSLNARW